VQGILYICALHIEFCRIFLAYLLAYPNLLGKKGYVVVVVVVVAVVVVIVDVDVDF